MATDTIGNDSRRTESPYWLLAGEIAQLSSHMREALFGYADTRFIFRIYSGDEALAIMENYRSGQWKKES